MTPVSGRICRSCGLELRIPFADLGQSPISNAYPSLESVAVEETYPLRAWVCERCLLVQIEDVATRETYFGEDYPYFSSFSETWLDHARRFADMATTRFALGQQSHVVEIGSNDGSLLKNFVARAIPSLGVDPAKSCADAARQAGVRTIVDFFGARLADRLTKSEGAADLIVANNVFAHVPDPIDFANGLRTLVKPEGSITLEFPSLSTLIAGLEFDTIYHEHYSYFSILALQNLFSKCGLKAYDVDHLPTHGGSLRLYVARAETGQAETEALAAAIEAERRAGLHELATYRAFESRVRAKKLEIRRLLARLKGDGARICGYGAPAKASTLLNYCGIGNETIDFTVDRNPRKQNRRIPGTGIPIMTLDALVEARPDYIVILPWNLRDELLGQLDFARRWGCKFILPLPETIIV